MSTTDDTKQDSDKKEVVTGEKQEEKQEEKEKPQEKQEVKSEEESIDWRIDPTRLDKRIAKASIDLVKANRKLFEYIQNATPANIAKIQTIEKNMDNKAQAAKEMETKNNNNPNEQKIYHEIFDMYDSCKRIDNYLSQEGLKAAIKIKPEPKAAQPAEEAAKTEAAAAPDSTTPSPPPSSAPPTKQ